MKFVFASQLISGVIPAKAGIHFSDSSKTSMSVIVYSSGSKNFLPFYGWIPAFAGMTQEVNDEF